MYLEKTSKAVLKQNFGKYYQQVNFKIAIKQNAISLYTNYNSAKIKIKIYYATQATPKLTCM